jgi:preprotein translocase subunit SecA
VSKSIETAQQKVEGFNFDARKYTVEYDDVMNRNREVIYGQRRRILEADDVKALALGVMRDHVAKLVDQHTDSPRPDEWDLEGLYTAASSTFGPDLQHDIDELGGESRDSLKEVIVSWAEELYVAKEQAYSTGLMQLAVRGTALRIIDGLWMEHLTAMDDMKAGIGLRAYGQRDPLTEYKGESYRMFQSLLGAIQSNLANAILRIQFVASPYLGGDQGEAPGAGVQGSPDEADGVAVGAEARPVADAPSTANPALARRVAALAQPPGPMRNVRTNEAPLAEALHKRPAIQDGRAITRAERKRQEAEAKREKKRELRAQKRTKR